MTTEPWRSVTRTGSLRLLDLETGDLSRASGRHAAAVSDARFTPDGRSVITTSDDGDVIVWDARRATATETLSGHAGFVFSPMISPDGTTLYTASLDGTVFIWDLAGRQRLGRPLRVGAEGTGSAGTALSSDGQVIAVARGGGAIALLDARSLRERRTVGVLADGQHHAPRLRARRPSPRRRRRHRRARARRHRLRPLDPSARPPRVHHHTRRERRRATARHGKRRRHRPALVAPRRAPAGGPAALPERRLRRPAQPRRPPPSSRAVRRERGT